MSRLSNMLEAILAGDPKIEIYYKGRTYGLLDEDCPPKVAATYIKNKLKELEEEE